MQDSRRFHRIVGAIGLFAVVICVSTACSRNPATVKRELLHNGDIYFDQHRYAEAVIEYRRAVLLDPKFAEARYKLAQSYDQLGDGANAAREYIRSAELLPNDPDAQVRAGLFLLVGGRFEDAESRARKALEVNPEHLEARLLLAQAIAGLSNLDGAVEEVEEAIQMDPSESRSFASLGALRVAQGKTNEAEAAFKQAVALDPRSVSAITALARFYFAAGRATETEEWLNKAVAIAPNDLNANRALAAFYITSNRLAEAERPLKAVALNAPTQAPSLVLADYYFAVKRKDEAKQILERLQDQPAVFADVRVRLSVLALSDGHRLEANKYVDEVLLKFPKSPPAALLKGRYLLADGQIDKALELLKTSVESDPNRASAHYWLGVAYRNHGDPRAARKEFDEVQRLAPAEVGSKLQLVQLDLLDGRLEAAASLANEAVAHQPGNSQARLTLVDVLVAQGKFPAAVKEAMFLSTNLPTNPQPQMQLGRIYLKQKNYAAAEHAFQRAVQLSGGAIDAIGALVDTQIAAGEIVEAQRTAEEQVVRNPKQPWFHIYAARAYKAGHDTVRAASALKEALAADPANLEAYLELTRIYLDTGKLDEARAQLEAIVAKRPNEVWAQTLIAMSLHVQNRKAEAQQRYEKILEIDPRAPIASNNLAMMYLDERKLELALQLAQTAKQQLPDSPEVNDTLGSIYSQMGLGSLAIPPLEVSIGGDPTNPIYHYHLGLAFTLVNDKVNARAAFQRALALNKDFEGHAEATRLMSER